MTAVIRALLAEGNIHYVLQKINRLFYAVRDEDDRLNRSCVIFSSSALITAVITTS